MYWQTNWQYVNPFIFHNLTKHTCTQICTALIVFGIWSLLRLVLSLTQRYSSTTTKINLLHFLRGTQKKIFWKMSGSRCTSKTYFVCVCVCVCVCVFSTRKKVNHIWNNMRVSEWLLYFHFRLYYPFKGALIYFIFIIISPVSLGYLLLDIFSCGIN